MRNVEVKTKWTTHLVIKRATILRILRDTNYVTAISSGITWIDVIKKETPWKRIKTCMEMRRNEWEEQKVM